MPEPIKVAKAELRELFPSGRENPNNRVQVQFNPDTLKVSFTNQIVPPEQGNPPRSRTRNAQDQRGTASTQFVGKGSTKLSVQLWFDVTGLAPQGQSEETDVRRLTQKVAYFITPKEEPPGSEKYVPPGIRFLWGTFQFDGIVESIEESLEYFSPEGKPLRASIALSVTQQRIQFEFAASPNAQSNNSAKPPVGAKPLTPAPAGSTLPGLAAKHGQGDNWQAIAQANNIENPRQMQPGQLIDMNARPPGANLPGLQ